MTPTIEQNVAEKIFEIYRRCKGRIDFLPWVEDINLNGGAGDLARAAGAGVAHTATPGSTDGFRVRTDKGEPRLMAWYYTCEDALGTTKTMVLRGSKEIRSWRGTRKVDLADVLFEDYSREGGIPLYPGEDLYATGGANGTNAACQHALVAMVYYPGLPEVNLYDGPVEDIVQQNISITTGSADQINYPGDDVITGFEDSEKDLPNDEKSKYVLLGLSNGPGLVDASVLAVRHPSDGTRDYIIPTSRAVDYTDQWYRGPGWVFIGSSPPVIGAHGHTAGAQIYGFRVGILQ